MQRLATSLGLSIVLTAMAPAAQAGSYAFSIGGHRFHIEAPRNCRSAACVSVSSRSLRPREEANTIPAPSPAPAPIVQAPQPVTPAVPIRPPQPIVVAPSPASTAPVLAATTSQPVVPPSAPRLEASRVEAPVLASRPESKQGTAIAKRSDGEATYLPLGEWESLGAKSTVRIERCGPALCGYALTETSSRGESVLVNMKPKSHDVWTGSIYSRSSGSTYYGKITLSSGTLHVEACVIGRFWCSGNDWTRVEEQQEKMVTTSRQWDVRS
ncbi:DUF2147 domain-containing protein [Bradyrhizobium huanghuaihaiense]|uniref:DUF2147 domain-containing protein n=1 Tax=Bradyrhizobium huanghuaihaiense TaxID=990078 RepID=UPI0021AAE5DC|nr:DUF2147 domain-containing protein [Bradyrhizobium sp. CB3035]UWU79197.1 DUF2147 domain-containing protein [Bradyrhizobium sp. CB3035]